MFKSKVNQQVTGPFLNFSLWLVGNPARDTNILQCGKFREQMVKLENGMGVLEVVITISPLLGLLGTVSGLVSVFATLGGSGDSGDPALIAAGIAVALNTTIAGLVVAVVMVIVHSYFSRRLERIAARLEVIAGHLLHEFFKNGGPQIYLREEAASVTPETGLARAIEESGRELGQPDFLT